MINELDLLTVRLGMRLLGQLLNNVFRYQVVNTTGSGITPSDAAEGWWNVFKTLYRAIAPSFLTDAFQDVTLEKLSSATGAKATYGIPLSEQSGTRSLTGPTAQVMPSFCAVNVTFNVGTTLTRPGSKRFPFITEEDHSAGMVNTPYLNSVSALGSALALPVSIITSSGALTIAPVVVKSDSLDSPTPVFQFITGRKANPVLTTQNSRKIGRGK